MKKLKCRIKHEIDTRLLDATTAYLSTGYTAFDEDAENMKIEIPVSGIRMKDNKFLHPYATKDGLFIPCIKTIMVEKGPGIKYLDYRPYYQMIPIETLQYLFDIINNSKS